MLCMLIIPPTQLCSQSSAVVSELPTTSGSELKIRTLPDQADVAINGRYVGRTPLTIVDLTPGTVRVNISRQGYHSVERWVRLRDQARIELDVVLEQKIGILSLSLEPADAEIYINGVQKTAEVLRLPAGDYTLYVTRFGYVDHRERLTIRENRTTVRHITLSPAPFELHNLNLSRRVFNPLHPGSAGSTSVRFDVTAAGSAALSVANAEGRTVFRHQISDFTRRRQRFVWDGQDRYNNPLPSGEYTLTVEAESADHTERIVRSLPLELDHSLDIGFRTTRSSASGALLAPDVIALPRGVFQVDAMATRHVASGSTSLDPALPVHLGLRLGLGSDLELAATGDLFISASGTSTHMQAGTSLRWVYSHGSAPFTSLSDRLIAGLQASLVLDAAGSGSVNPYDANANWPSLRLASPVGLRSSHFRLVLAPELVVSNSYPDDKTDYSAAGFPLFWSYTRAALFYDYRGFSAALSAAVRHEPFVHGWSVAAPLYTAVELHQSIPRTPVVLSLFSSAEITRGSGPTLFLGAGLGILY
ncbi:MAG: PEGA domain-containing protein [Spirochaetaceae bacterium]|nr:MAG: PEGA domain-containing protein [Spirochaetaceae bacterium]